MSGGPGPAQGNGPLLAGAGTDTAGGQSGGDAEDDEAKKRALPAGKAKKPGKGSGPDPDVCSEAGHPVDTVSGAVVDSATELLLRGAFRLEWQRWYSSARHREQGALGRGGWKHAFEQWIELSDVVTYRNADGRDIWFPNLAPGSSSFHRRERLTLERGRAGDFRLEAHDEHLSYEFAPLVPGGRAWLVAIRDAYGHRATFGYEGERLTRIVDSVGRELRLRYGAHGYVSRVELWASAPLPAPVPGLAPAPAEPSRLVQWVDYDYHETEELARAADALGHADHFAYDGMHRMIATTLKNGVAFYYVYDDTTGRCIKTWGDGGLHEVEFAYDLAAHTTTLTATNEPRLLVWNDDGVVVEERTHDGRVQRTIAWDADLYLVSEANGAGETVHYEHDERGNLTKRVDAAGNETRWEWSGDSVTRKKGADGLVTRYVHDRHGAPVAVTYPTGATFELVRDAEGRIARIAGPEGTIVAYGYDSHTNACAETNGRGATTAFAFDALGRPTAMTDPLGRITRIRYDALGRPTHMERPNGAVTTWDYDPLGNPRAVGDALGQVTRLEWGGTGTVHALEEPGGARYTFEYDSDERLVAVKNPRSEVYRFEYDAAGRAVREKTFDGRVLEFSYNRAERLARIEYADDTAREFAYDKLGRVVADRSAHGSIEFERDALGRLKKATVDEVGGPVVVAFERDAFGRVTREVQDGLVVASEFDALGRRVSRTVATGNTTHYRYDACDALVGVAHGAQRVELSRDALGREARRRFARGEVELESRYDVVDQLIEQRVTAPGEAHALRRTLAERAWTYDPAGRVTSERDGRWGSARYRYDDIGQLVSAQRGRSEEVFAYDPTGALVRALSTLDAGPTALAKSGTADGAPWRLEPGNLLREADGTAYENDVRGRRRRSIERGPEGSERETRFVWDCRDRLREVRLPDGRVVRYRYDAFARRVSKEIRPATQGPLDERPNREAERTRFVWDGDVLCEERSASARRTFVHEPGTHCPLLQEEEGKIYSYVLDRQGVPRELVDEEGRVAWAALSSAWGRTLDVKRDPGTRAVSSPFRLLGQYADEETGLAYAHHRYFDPRTARWLSPDPISLSGGLDLFGFNGCPLAVVDPEGLVCEKKRPPGSPRLDNPNVKKVVWHEDGSVTYHFHGGFRVTYTAAGFPDFSPHAMRRGGEPVIVRIKYTGDRGKDFTAARNAAGLTKADTEGYTWHHMEDVRVGQDGTHGSMILVKTEVHDTAKHRGGVSVHKERGGSGYEDDDH